MDTAQGPLKTQLELFQVLHEIERAMQGSARLSEVLQHLTQHVGQLLRVSRCFLRGTQGTNLYGMHEWAAPGITSISSLPFGSVLDVLQVADFHEARSIADIWQNAEMAEVFDAHPEMAKALREWDVRAMLTTPIRAEERLLGVLVLHQCESPREWIPDEIHLCNMVAGHLAVAVRHLEMLDQEEQLKIAERLISVTEAERNRLVQILESTPDFVLTTDRKGVPLYANRAALELLGWDPDLFGENGILDHIFPQWASHVIRTVGIPTAIQDGVWQGAVEMFDQTHKAIPVSIVIIAHRNQSEPIAKGSSGRQVTWFSLIARDMTEQQRTQESLRLAESRFSRMIDIAADAVIAVDEHQTISLFNKAAEQMFGYSALEVFGKPFEALLPDRYKAVYAAFTGQTDDQVDGFLQMGNGRELYGRRKTGEEFPAEVSMSKLSIAGGALYTVILRDVTERKRAEEQLERLRRHLELILNAAGEGIYGVDCNGQITFINPAALQVLGWQVEDLLGRSAHDVVHQGGADAAPQIEQCPVCSTLKSGVARRSDSEHFFRRDGQRFPVEYIATPIYEQEEIVGAVVAFKDVTEREAVERLKDQFLSIVSHELRTPLTAVSGALELLSERVLGSLPDRAQRMIDIAVKNTDRLVRLINDILDIERLRFGKVSMEMKRCNIVDLLQGALDATQAVATAAQVTVVPTFIAGQVWADPDRMVQTLTNLIGNAIKFSPPGAAVHVTAQIRSNVVQFCVADKGRGIPADKLDIIFEPFKQVDASDARQKGGTGLGLAICRSIVDQHGGRIWVESELGVGSSFYFTLPLLDQSHGLA